jgi:gamma-D-glutamyl-L-lysine dipeptidyl-peptidase
VGILLAERKIVHASGKVRIDRLTNEGIINEEDGRKTHQLHFIRRVL